MVMNTKNLGDRVNLIKGKREFLLKLSEQPKLGILKLDVSQALSELDDLIEDFSQTFPELD